MDPTPTTPESPPADSGLRCPKCEYNLTGVAENRCPECGEAFDPEQLRAILEGASAPIPIWDDEYQPVHIRFFKMCLFTWFSPVEVGRTFPCRYSKDSAASFRRTVLWVSTFLPTIAVLLTRDESLIVLFLFAGLFYLFAVLSCEAILTFLLCGPARRSAAQPPQTNPLASDSLKGLIGLFRSFVLLETAGLSVISVFCAAGVIAPMPAAMICTLVIGGWWMVSLASAVAVRRDGLDDVFAALVIMVLGIVLSLFVAGVASVAVVSLLALIVVGLLRLA